MTRDRFDIDEVRRFIEDEPLESRIFIGCDSEVVVRKRTLFVDYYVVCVVHKSGHRGCKIFGYKTTEPSFEKTKRRPLYRLMNEVYKAAELYVELADAIGPRDCEVHLDLNPSAKHASNQIVDQAIGYIKGVCNVTPIIKPDAWAATHVADRLLKIQRG